MKKFTFILFFAFAGIILQGQPVSMLNYLFYNTLSETNGNGPTLTMIDSAGMFVMDTLTELNGIIRPVYRFKKDAGVQFNNALAGSFLDSTYSLEIYFKFDEISGYRRVIDWKNRTSDFGAYVLDGLLDFYPWTAGTSTTVLAGQYTYYVITRNGLTKNIKIYSNAIKEIDFTDTGNDGVIDTSHVLNFFSDDLVTPNEASPGAVALLNLYNYVLDSTTIVHKFDSLQGEITAIRTIGNKTASLLIYPNPASDKVNVDLSQFSRNGNVNISFVNSTGSVVYERTCHSGSSYLIDLNPLSLASGIYIVKAESSGEIYTRKFVIRR